MDDEMTARVARLEAVLETQQRQIDELRRENAGLRSGPAVAAPAPDEASGRAAGSRPPTVDRRRALLGMAGAAAAAGAATLAATAQPAAAANGNPLVIGSDVNVGTAPTGLSVSGKPTYGFGVTDNGSGSIFERPALFGHAKDQAFWTGVYGVHDGGGIAIHGEAASGFGIVGQTDDGTAVSGQALDGTGGYFLSSGGATALWAEARGGSGAVGLRINAPTPIKIDPTSLQPHPNTTASAGEIRWASDGLWACVAGSTGSGTWRKVAGPATAGSLHVLTTPTRVYDSRPGTQPTQGPKTPLAATPRAIFVNANSSGVPTTATSVLLTVLLVNAAAGNGNMTIWRGGTAKPAANTMVWGPSGGRFTTMAISRIDTQARISIDASLRTDVVLDVVGYYR